MQSNISNTMMTGEKYKGIYRIPSARWQDWDYGTDAIYFVTICTAQREHYFGEITDGEMQLSAIGQAAHDCWQQIPAHFPFALLDAFVIMPNHVHGIIVIDKPEDDVSPSSHARGGVAGDKNPMLHDNLSRIIRWYKGRTTFEVRQIHADFAWLSRFHDRVIRNYAEFTRIAQYIDANITNWTDDELYGH